MSTNKRKQEVQKKQPAKKRDVDQVPVKNQERAGHAERMEMRG